VSLVPRFCAVIIELRALLHLGVDPLFKIVDSPLDIANRAKKPMLYVLGVDSQMGVRDVTGRYAGEQFLSMAFRKQRTDEDWLRKTLNMAVGPVMSPYL
jgi:Rad4 transglutaminase-like domain